MGSSWEALNSTGIYGLIDKAFKALTPLRKIGIGFFLTVPAFLLPAWIQSGIDSGAVMNISWQALAYVIMTAAEVFVSITCLEFSYTQALKNEVHRHGHLPAECLPWKHICDRSQHLHPNRRPKFEADRPGEYVIQY